MRINMQTNINSNIKNILFMNNVLKNTYLLLSFSIIFSAAISYISIILNLKPLGLLFDIGIFFTLIFLINKFKNSVYGILFVFLFTGFFGYMCSHLIGSILKTSNGYYTITMALAYTGIIFFALSIYSLFSKRNFSFLNSFIFIGFILFILMLVMSYFFPMPILNLLISAIIIIISSASILYQTSRIINDGETNYILITIDLYCSIFNIFISLLNIFRDE